MTNRYLDKIAGNAKGIMAAMEKGIGTVQQALGKGVSGPAMRMRRLSTAEELARNKATFAANKVQNPDVANKYFQKAETFKTQQSKVEPVLNAAKTQQRQAKGIIGKKVLKGSIYGTVGYNAAKGLGVIGQRDDNQYYQ